MTTSLLERYAQGAAERLGGRTSCSLTLSDAGRLRQVASNDPRAAACDRVEAREARGPCIQAMDELHSVLIPEIDAEHRWPHWRETALAHGFRSFVAFPAYVDDRLTVAANVYSEDPALWSRSELVAVDVFVQELAAALAASGDTDDAPG